MDTIAKAMSAQGGSLAEIAKLLYGDGAWEFISKMGVNPEVSHKKKDDFLRGVAIAGTATGAALGVSEVGHGLRGVAKPAGRLMKVANKIPKIPGGHKTQLGVAGTMLGSDVLATSELKKPKKQGVIKALTTGGTTGTTDSTPPSGLKTKSSGMMYSGGRPLRKIGAAAGAAVQQTVAKNFEIEWGGEISKVDSDKRQVFGWASVISMNGKPVVDLQNDYMELDTIEKAAYNYVRESRKGGNMHERDGEAPKHVSDLIESFVVTEDKKKALGLPDEFPTGWLVGFQVNDDETWAQVKDGKRKEFSIHGSGQRVEKVLD